MPAYIRFLTFSPCHAVPYTWATYVQHEYTVVPYSFCTRWPTKVIDQYRHIIQLPVCCSLLICSVMVLHSTLPYLINTVCEWLYTIDVCSPCRPCFAVLSLFYSTVPNLYGVITPWWAVSEHCANVHCWVLYCGAMSSAYCIVLHAVRFEWTVVCFVLYPTPEIDSKNSKKYQIS